MNYQTTPRFDKEYSSFTRQERLRVKSIKFNIINDPTSPETNEWKILHQFDKIYPDGFVAAVSINHFDRLVYEFNITTGMITFTNCRGHKYRGHTYSTDEEEIGIIRTFSEIKNACTTKEQKLAFNRLMNTFKFKDIK